MKYLFIILSLALVYLGSEVRKLHKDVTTLKKISFLSQNQLFDQQRRLAEKYRKQSSAVLSIRCKDSKKGSWNGTGFKISEDVVVSAGHLINREIMPDSKVKNNYPIKCELYSEDLLVGSFESDKNNFKFVQSRDIVLLKVAFRGDPEIEPLNPFINHELYEGEPVIMISHPGTFVEDYIISFGYIVNANADKIQPKTRKEAWTQSFLTDMVAAPGSSGSPVLTLNEEVIGIHVGGDLNKKLRINHQLLFDTKFFIDFQLMKISPVLNSSNK